MANYFGWHHVSCGIGKNGPKSSDVGRENKDFV